MQFDDDNDYIWHRLVQLECGEHHQTAIDAGCDYLEIIHSTPPSDSPVNICSIEDTSNLILDAVPKNKGSNNSQDEPQATPMELCPFSTQKNHIVPTVLASFFQTQAQGHKKRKRIEGQQQTQNEKKFSKISIS